MRQIITFCTILFVSASIFGQDIKWPKVDASPMDMITYPANAAWRNYLSGEDRNKTPQIKLVYSRPAKNNRKIFGELVPFGKEWRLGANEATTITFYQSVGIGGFTLAPGTYTIFAEVNPSEWNIILSSQGGIWGEANRDKSKDVASVKVPVLSNKVIAENLSMTFQEVDPYTANLVIDWDQTRVICPISFNPIEFEELDVSPMDMAHFPSKSAYTNYLEGDEKNLQPAIQVTYSRPYKKDRKVFGDVVKPGEMWRIGANQSTEIAFFNDVNFGGTDVKKGRYAMYAMVNDNGTWDIILSKDYPAWGHNNRDESKDAYTIKGIKTSQDKEVLENLSITFAEKSTTTTDLIIGWDTTRASIPVIIK